MLGGSSGFCLHDFYIILAGRAVPRVGVALIVTSSTTLIGDYFDEQTRYTFMSRQGMRWRRAASSLSPPERACSDAPDLPLCDLSASAALYALFFHEPQKHAYIADAELKSTLQPVNTNAWFLSKVPPHKRGKASGILASSLFLGQFSSPLLFEPIVSCYGIQGLFMIIASVALSIAMILLLVSPQRVKKSKTKYPLHDLHLSVSIRTDVPPSISSKIFIR